MPAHRLPIVVRIFHLYAAGQGFHTAFDAEPASIRLGLRALLEDWRLAARKDEKQGFRADGLLSLPPIRKPPGVLRTPGGSSRW